MFPFPLENFFGGIFDPVIFFVGEALFGLTLLAKKTSHSGDTTFDYVRIGTLLILSIFLGLIYLLTLKNKFPMQRLRNITFLYAKYYVGLFMINYGIAKLCEGQFSMPSYGKLEQTFGNSSPMGLLWTFMGVSKPYTIFIGCSQIFSGYLILFKRTQTVGLLLTTVIMINVVLINFCYDVPVKLFSAHLVLITVFLAIPDLKSLYAFFILRLPAQLPVIVSLETKHKTARFILKALVIVGYTVFCINVFLNYSFTSGPYAAQSRINGAYYTDKFVIENDTLPPLTSDSIRWKSIIISQSFSKVTKMTDSVERFNIVVDSIARTITFSPLDKAEIKYRLNYAENGGRFQLTGIWKGKRVTAFFSKKTYGDYPLINRGFHWINETIYNR